MVGELELTNLVRVGHPARLEHVEPAVSLAARFDVPHQEPGIDERGEPDLAPLERVAMGEVGEERGDLVALEHVHEPHQHRLGVRGAPDRNEVADRVHHHRFRREGADQLVHHGQVRLETVTRRPFRMDAKLSLRHERLEVEPDRAHVADDLLRRLFEGEIQGALAAPAGLGGEMGSDAGLSGSGRAGDQDAGAAVQPSIEHRIEAGHTGRDPVRRNRVIEPQRGDREHVDALVVDQERIFVGAVNAAAVLDDPQPAGRDLVDHPMIQKDDAVRDVLLEPLPRETALAALAGDDRRHSLVLEPAEQPPDFGAQDPVVREPAEQGLDRVEHHALRADRVDRMARSDEQALEVVFAALLDLRALDADVVDHQLVLTDQPLEIEAQRRHVRRQLPGGLLEAHEHARLVVLEDAAHQEFGGEQGLAAARAAAHQRGTAARQAAAGDLVEALDAGRCLRQRRERFLPDDSGIGEGHARGAFRELMGRHALIRDASRDASP